MSAKTATASFYLPTILALEQYLKKVKNALEPSKHLSTHKLAFEFSEILLDKLIDQKSRSKILSNDLLMLSQLLDPRFVRKACSDDDTSISKLSKAYLYLFGEDLTQDGNSNQVAKVQLESNDLMDILNSDIHNNSHLSTESAGDENSIECKIKVTFVL